MGRKIDRSTNTGAVLVLIIHSAVGLLFALGTQLLQVLTVHSASDLEVACTMMDSTGGTDLKTAPTVGVQVVLLYGNFVATFRLLQQTELSKEGICRLSYPHVWMSYFGPSKLVIVTLSLQFNPKL